VFIKCYHNALENHSRADPVTQKKAKWQGLHVRLPLFLIHVLCPQLKKFRYLRATSHNPAHPTTQMDTTIATRTRTTAAVENVDDGVSFTDSIVRATTTALFEGYGCQQPSTKRWRKGRCVCPSYSKCRQTTFYRKQEPTTTYSNYNASYDATNYAPYFRSDARRKG
jgi:hypothetical protein